MIAIPGTVLCLGNLVQDVLARNVEGVSFDTTTWIEEIRFSLGGNGASTAYAIAMLGGEVRLMGAVGVDTGGDRLLEALRSAGVDTSQVKQVRVASTATSVALVNSAGARALIHNPGASLAVSPAPFDKHLTEGCSHFHLANPFGLPGSRARASEALQFARSAGLTTSLDTGWDSAGEWFKIIGPCLPELDLLFVNEEESKRLTELSHPLEAGRCLAGYGVKVVVVKRGARGCSVLAEGRWSHFAAYPVEVVDTTGAGDCFCGAFLAALYHGSGIEAAAILANAAGALSASQLGATTGLLRYDATLRWIEGHMK